MQGAARADAAAGARGAQKCSGCRDRRRPRAEGTSRQPEGLRQSLPQLCKS